MVDNTEWSQKVGERKRMNKIIKGYKMSYGNLTL